MATSSSLTTIPLHEPVFNNFSMMFITLIPSPTSGHVITPTLIPNIEPTSLPSTSVWNQPPGFLPNLDYSDETNAFIDGAPLPSPDLEAEEKFMQELVDYNLPPPHQHVDAPVPASVPTPPKLSTASQLPSKKRLAKATPKAPGKRRRKASLSPVPSPSSPPIWTDEDKKILRTLKTDERSRFSWKVIAGKLGKPEHDVQTMWNHIKNRMG